MFGQCDGGKKKFGGIAEMKDLKKNLEAHCIPVGLIDMTADDYEDFLRSRRQLMAAKIKRYFALL